MILKSLATSVLSNFDFPEKIGSFKLLVTGVLVGPSKPASGMQQQISCTQELRDHRMSRAWFLE